MSTDDITLELTEADFDEYLAVCFAISKGTANVSPTDRKKLHPLLRHYAKMKHPFTACVRDNRKRFGAKTEAYCAVLKDLIVGSTNWRGKGKKYTPRALSEQEFDDTYGEFKVDFPEGFAHFIQELTEEDIQAMIGTEANFATGDVVWNPNNSLDSLRRRVQESLNDSLTDHEDGEEVVGYSYWVEDIQDKKALVCFKGTDYFIVPFSMKNDNVTVSEEEEWVPVERAWIETNLSQDNQVLAEMYFADSDVKEENDLIWKTTLREGTWKYSPGPGQVPVPRPISVVKEGTSDPIKNVISMQEILQNFENNTVEHVTVPLSHKDHPIENTGFVRAMRMGSDKDGKAILEVGIDFTEPEVKEKVKRGTIPNISGGILFDYLHKETGKKYNAVMAHAALTPHPWLNGMKPFGVEASENLKVLAFSEENNNDTNDNSQGGDNVSATAVENENITTSTFFDEIGLSESEVKSRLERFEALEAENRKNRIDSKCNEWQEAGKSPALVKEAKSILMADSGSVIVNLSEDGASKALTLSEVVDRLMSAAPSKDLTQDPGNEAAATEGGRPDDDPSNENVLAGLSDNQRAEIISLMFDENLSEADAIDKVVKASKASE